MTLSRRSSSALFVCRKAARNVAFVAFGFSCFIFGSLVSLSTLDPGSCDLNLCTRRIQKMSEDESMVWDKYWDKSGLQQNKKVFLVILVLSAPKHFELRNTVRQTWLTEETSDTLHYFVVGTAGLSEEINVTLHSEQRRFSDLLLLPNVHDSYKTLTQKLLSSLVYINSNIHFRFLLKCDDDTFVQLHRLQYELKDVPFKQRVYWGFFDGRAKPMSKGTWQEEKWLLCDRYLPYALGGGYIISHDLVAFIAYNRDMLQLYNNEDVALGVWLAPIELHRIHDTKFDTEYKSRGCNNDYLLTHKQTVVSMREKFNNLQAYGVICRDQVQLRRSYIYNWKVPPSRCCARNDSSLP